MILNYIKKYCLISKFDLSQLLKTIQELKSDVLNLTNENKELKETINNFLENGQDVKNNNCCCWPGANVGHDPTPETQTRNNNNILQDTLTHKYNLSLINDKGKENKRYYFKSKYMFTTSPKYYKRLNLKFNELMTIHKDINTVKPLLKNYLYELKSNELN